MSKESYREAYNTAFGIKKSTEGLNMGERFVWVKFRGEWVPARTNDDGEYFYIIGEQLWFDTNDIEDVGMPINKPVGYA
ncbi:hypothetical protein LCGC14_2449010 [marine sediment metagenome]|uniref:Uncharacterized protein n=1 Tax=marine sediment metagenome TaxID=412755 RepID=A0A0F9EAK0_9ZZZZ